jgi:hypothetical protein
MLLQVQAVQLGSHCLDGELNFCSPYAGSKCLPMCTAPQSSGAPMVSLSAEPYGHGSSE